MKGRLTTALRCISDPPRVPEMAPSNFSDPPPGPISKSQADQQAARAFGGFSCTNSERFRSAPRTCPSWHAKLSARVIRLAREGRAMDESNQTHSWISDTQAMALYSTLFFLVMVLWVYVPA
jgi:hypothetical protein